MKDARRKKAGAFLIGLSALCLACIFALSFFRINALAKQANAAENSLTPSRIIFLGTAGISWDLINPQDAPNLYFAAHASSAKLANFVTKISADTACPDAAWLTLNTGVRTFGLAAAEEHCRDFPKVEKNSAGALQIPNWQQYLTANADNKYKPHFGNLAQILQTNQKSVGIIGHAPALAFADDTGVLGKNITVLAGLPPVARAAVPLANPETERADGGLGAWPQHLRQLQRAVAQLADKEIVFADLGIVRSENAALREQTEKDAASVTALQASFQRPLPPTKMVREQVREIDQRFAAVLAAFRENMPLGQDALHGREELQGQATPAGFSAANTRQPPTRIIFASLAERDRSGAKMQAYFEVDLADLIQEAAEELPAPLPADFARSLPAHSEVGYANSTRIAGLVQNTDLLPTLAMRTKPTAEKTQLSFQNAVGAPITKYLGQRAGENAFTFIQQEGLKAELLRATLGYGFIVFPTFAGLSVICAGLCLYAARRKQRRQPQSQLKLQPQQNWQNAVFPKVYFLLLTASSLPCAVFFVNLLPWWKLPFPRFALLCVIFCIAVLIAVIAWQLPRLLCSSSRKTLAPAQLSAAQTPLTHFTPVLLIALLTAGVLIADLLTGSYLQFSAIFGIQAQHAGRFYGFGNTAFVIFAVSMLTIAAFGLHFLRSIFAPKWYSVIFVVLLLLIAVYVDGSPILGADFGGPPALILGFLVLLLLHFRRCPQRSTLLGFAAFGFSGAVAIAIFDWLQPKGSQTHLGAFIDAVLAGELFTVISRKFSELFVDISVLIWLAVALLTGGLIWVLRRYLPQIQHTLTSDLVLREGGIVPADFLAVQAAISALLLFALTINDSGLLLPFIGLVYGLPLCFALIGSAFLCDKR